MTLSTQKHAGTMLRLNLASVGSCVEIINRLATGTLHQKSEETGRHFLEAAERVPKGTMIRPFVKLTKTGFEDWTSQHA